MNVIQNLLSFTGFPAGQALWLLWFLMFFLFLIMSAVFSYQWRHYALQKSGLHFGQFIYYILGIFCLGFSALCIILFNANL